MNLVCVIDDLGSGGAQRQLCSMAISLKNRGFSVRFLIFNNDLYFAPQLREEGILFELVESKSKVKRFFAIRRQLFKWSPDVVISFLESPNLFVELAGIMGRRWRLLAGERSAHPGIGRGLRRWNRYFHHFADAVVCNSHTNRLLLELRYPFLKGKLVTVYNSVDFEKFKPRLGSQQVGGYGGQDGKTFRIVVAASYRKNKNMINVARALSLMKERRGFIPIEVEWFGSVIEVEAYEEVSQYILKFGLEDHFQLHGVSRNIELEFERGDAVGLFSGYEGLPNAVCEAMACGKAIILSDVCDSSNLVLDGKNGFLCDPDSPKSIENAFWRVASLSSGQLQELERESTRVAKELFGQDEVVRRYHGILESICNEKVDLAKFTWPARVPESSIKTVEKWSH